MRARTLAPKQAQKLLIELVNLHVDDPPAVRRFQKMFGDLIPPFRFANWDPPANKLSLIRTTLLTARLQNVWKSPDERSREFLIFSVRQMITGTRDPYLRLSDPLRIPPPSAFEQAILYLHRVRHRTVVCQNPECPARYFFATRRTQRFCSEECAKPAQREAKRRWWEKSGTEWRRKHKQADRTRKR